jgi:hypothetical protein
LPDQINQLNRWFESMTVQNVCFADTTKARWWYSDRYDVQLSQLLLNLIQCRPILDNTNDSQIFRRQPMRPSLWYERIKSLAISPDLDEDHAIMRANRTNPWLSGCMRPKPLIEGLYLKEGGVIGIHVPFDSYCRDCNACSESMIGMLALQWQTGRIDDRLRRSSVLMPVTATRSSIPSV